MLFNMKKLLKITKSSGIKIVTYWNPDGRKYTQSFPATGNWKTPSAPFPYPRQGSCWTEILPPEPGSTILSSGSVRNRRSFWTAPASPGITWSLFTPVPAVRIPAMCPGKMVCRKNAGVSAKRKFPFFILSPIYRK
jgi:hypothetical protein